jgi:DNA repair exonuclease SbcCD ATPase subunit
MLLTHEEETAKLNSQIEELNNFISMKDAKIEELSSSLGEKEKIIGDTTAQLEEVEAELDEFKPPEIGTGGFAAEERVTCPMCGAVGSDIKTVEDKSKVLSYIGHIPMYAKKQVCKKCGYEF